MVCLFYIFFFPKGIGNRRVLCLRTHQCPAWGSSVEGQGLKKVFKQSYVIRTVTRKDVGRYRPSCGIWNDSLMDDTRSLWRYGMCFSKAFFFVGLFLFFLSLKWQLA